MILYLPPKGTAGFATTLVSKPSRLPCPPASNMAMHRFFLMSSIPAFIC